MKNECSYCVNFFLLLKHKAKLICVSLSLMLVFSFVSVFAQPGTKPFNDLNSEVINRSVLDERVLLTTDRCLYLCGENIVFDAFIYEGNWFLPLQTSSVLYVELYNQDNLVISKGKIFMSEGRGSGTISIPRDISSDIYNIRAYTNYMKNFGIQQFFTQKLKIVNPFHDNSVYANSPTRQVLTSCQVFPEGGNLAEGIKSTVVCRFTDLNGKGMDVTARVLDMNNNLITSFKTYKNGFASFEFTPSAGISYYIEVSDGAANLITPLPKPLKSGLTFAIDTLTSDFLRIKITSNDITVFPLRLDAWRGGFVYPLIDSLIYSAGKYEISTHRIPTGLIKLTLTNNEGKSLTNRLLYLNSSKKLEITLKTDKEKYDNRENVDVIINTRNNGGAPVKTKLLLLSSLSQNGYKASDYTYPDADLLQQELKQMYFGEDDLILRACSDNKLLDMILLSAHLPLRKISHESELKYLPEFRGDIISGKLVYKNDLPAKGINVLQSFAGNTSSIESSITDDNGNFYFLTYAQNNKGDLILKVQNTDLEISVIPDDEFFRDFPTPSRVALNLTEDDIKLISEQFINIQVDDAFSAENNNKPGKVELEKLPFYGKEYVEYKFPDYLKLPNMKEFIFEVIQGVILSKENDIEVINILDENNFEKLGPHPLIIINGVPVTESSIVIGLPSEKVKSIRVVRNKYFYKDLIFDGILDITTYTQNASAFDFPKGTYRYNFVHPDEGKIFIESKLSTDAAGRVPIYKNQLYWNSDITTDKDGSAKVSFITPDNSGTFEIRCYCLSPEGIAGERIISIKVGK